MLLCSLVITSFKVLTCVNGNLMFIFKIKHGYIIRLVTNKQTKYNVNDLVKSLKTNLTE